MCSKLELIHQQQLDTVHYNFKQSARGRKKVAVSRSRISRERGTLMKKLEHQMKLTNKHKMRYSRLQRKLKTPQATANTPSQRTNTRRLLRCLGGNPSKLQEVKKTLDFHYSLLKDLKNRLAESKDEKERQVIARFFTGSLVMKLGGCPFNGPLSGTKYPTRAASPIQNASTPKSSLPFSKHRSCALLCTVVHRF